MFNYLKIFLHDVMGGFLVMVLIISFWATNNLPTFPLQVDPQLEIQYNNFDWK